MTDMNMDQILSDILDESSPVEEKPKIDIQLTADAVVSLVGMTLKAWRKKSDAWFREYVQMNSMILGLLGFDEALRSMPLSSLPPWAVLLIGFGILGVSGILLPEPEHKGESNNEFRNSRQVGFWEKLSGQAVDSPAG